MVVKEPTQAALLTLLLRPSSTLQVHATATPRCSRLIMLKKRRARAQALIERIRPVMTVNKLDRCFLELMLDGEEAFMGFRRTIESANVIMATYADELLGDTQARAPRA